MRCRISTAMLASALLAISFYGCGQEPTGTELSAAPGCTVAVLGSDYSSTSVTLLDGEGNLCAPDYVNSGSALPGLVTAFSGDVVVPTSPHPEGLLTLIDRYPNSVVTLVDVDAGEMRGRFSVGDNFAANPQDIFFWSAQRAYVTRHEPNPTPTPELDDFDEGDDVLILNPETGKASGRIDLTPFAPSGADGESFRARPGRMVYVGGKVWTALRGLSDDYQRAGNGLLVGIDGASDSVTDTLELPDARNCGGLSATPAETGFWGVCTGVFYDGVGQQVAGSAIFFAGIEDGEAQVAAQIPAGDLQGRPLGLSVVAVDHTRVVYVALGDLDAGTGDELMLYNREIGDSLSLNVEGGAFELGAMNWHSESGLLLVPRADAAQPEVLRLIIKGDGISEVLLPVGTSPDVGLPPRQVRAFR